MKNIKVPRLQDKFIDLIRWYMYKDQVNIVQLAELAKTDHSRISELMHKRRVLSTHYVAKFIRKGVFTVDEILNGDTYEMKADEKDTWDALRAMEDTEIQDAMAKALNNGLPREAILAFLKNAVRPSK